MSEIVNAELVDEPGTDLEPIQTASPANLFGTDNPAEVMERAVKVADVLKGALVQRGMVSNIQGKEFVGVEGWQTLGGLLGVSAVVTHTERLELDGKTAYKAHVEARTLDGRVIGAADAICHKGEKRGPWKGADDYALLSMAQTRATSKALKAPLGFVVKLAGYETTPAEEMAGVADEEPPTETIDPATAVQLMDDMRAKGLTLRDITGLLAGAGDAQVASAHAKGQALSKQGVENRISLLSPEQADAIRKELA